MPRVYTFLAIFLGASLALASFTAISCNGNGVSSDAEGEIYMGGTSTGSTSGGRRVAVPVRAQAAPVPAAT